MYSMLEALRFSIFFFFFFLTIFETFQANERGEIILFHKQRSRNQFQRYNGGCVNLIN